MGQLIGLVVLLGLIGLVIALLLLAAVYIVPVVLVAACIIWFARHPYYKVRTRFHDLRSRYAYLSVPDGPALTEAILTRYLETLRDRRLLPPTKAICSALCQVIDELVADERIAARFVLPAPPTFQWQLRPGYWRLIGELDALEQNIDRLPRMTERFEGAIAEMLVSFTAALPQSARQSWDEFDRDAEAPPSAFLTIPLYDAIKRPGDVVSAIGHEFVDREVEELGLFSDARTVYIDNVSAQSERQLTKTAVKEGALVPASAFIGSPAEIVNGYLSGTPWHRPFTMPVPFTFDARRFQHQWVVAPTGSGKTQLLKAQIVADLARVARDEASIVVIDSQGTKPGTLIGDLIRLKLFAKGQPLENRLVFLDPDPSHPLALNLFDFGLDEIDALSERERRAYLTSAIDLAEFIINGLVGAEQTPMMKGISRYIIQALMVIPDATIETFRDLMAKGGLDKYRPYLANLDDYTRDFFETRFNAPQYEITKAGIFWRLDTMMADPTFRDMFLNPRNKLDLAKELNAGKVIVVNTDRELLKADGTEAFGRFILAKLLLATGQRASEANPLPTYVYIDECQDYIADEERIADLIDKARKQRVGLIFAHQRLGNIRSANVADALANTAIQFAGGNKTDAAALAGYLHADPEFIEGQPTGSFVAYVKSQTDHGIQVSVPLGVMDRMEKMTREEEAVIRADMRDRYCLPKRPRRQSSASPVDTQAPTKWDS